MKTTSSNKQDKPITDKNKYNRNTIKPLNKPN